MGGKSRLNSAVHRAKEYTLKGIVELFHGNPGESIFDEEWDQLVILDDCRFDTFEKEFRRRNLPGTLKPKTSLGSWTGEFLRENFRGRYAEIVFVSANPFSEVYLRGKFHALISVWKTGWSETHQTVPPGAVYSAAVRAAEEYPDKKLIVHFLQPHHPYFALNFRDNTMGVIRNSISRGNLRMDTIPDEPINELYLSPIYGKFHIRRLMKAYEENLRIVMPYVELLLHRLKGKTVVTSDHGELFGETVSPVIPIKVYGHGVGRNNGIIQVPWWVVTDKDRENLTPVKDLKREIAIVERRLGLVSPEKERLKKVVKKLRILGRI